MNENQNVEFKINWNDEHLKWVCGFANAGGGKIFIGKDDKGNIHNLKNSKKLMEDIPNKIRNKLGIIPEVILHEFEQKNHIEIVINPHSVPVSFRGRYYYRSGSTKIELTGNSLNEFLLRKSGKTWDAMIEPTATLSDIDEQSISQYLKDADRSGRLPDASDLELSVLLEKLRLVENSKLKRTAIVLFGKDPGYFYPNQIVKIGRFGKNDADLIFQEVVEGNLIHLLYEVPKILNAKFLIKPIDFEGLLRIEKNEYPVAALREMLLNALVHRNYMGTTIQIRVYENKISFWNEGKLPEDLPLAALKRQHPSRPRNPIIADVCFKGGYIDAWGRGTIKIIDACKLADLPEPEMKEIDGGFLITVYRKEISEDNLITVKLNERQKKAIEYVKKNNQITNTDYQKINKISKPTATRDIQYLVEKGILINVGTKGSSAIYELAFH